MRLTIKSTAAILIVLVLLGQAGSALADTVFDTPLPPLPVGPGTLDMRPLPQPRTLVVPLP